MEMEVEGTTIELTRGDIASQEDLEAVVNAANAELRTGGGVAGALHQAAGAGLAEECRPLAPIGPGEAVITSGHLLPNRWVIHTLGPVYGRDEPSDRLLADCYRRSLELAEENEIVSVGFPALSTGAFGYPVEEAARIAMETVVSKAPDLEHVERVRFVLWGEDALGVHEEALEEVAGG
ncbi:MAG: macro domain-containing protein [bacterium]